MDSVEVQTFNKRIAKSYDERTGAWEETYGQHMHAGFYDSDAIVSASLSDHKLAQTRLIEEALRLAGLTEDSKKFPKNMVDVGCGIGGTCLYLAKKYGVKCHGINLSPVQIQRASSLAAANGLADKVFFQVADAAEQPFPDGEFDLVWIVETAEYIPDRKRLLSELARVAAAGGTIIIISVYHRNLSHDEVSLQEWEKQYLQKMTDAYYLPGWSSPANDMKLFKSLRLQDIKAADWSEKILPFWKAQVESGKLN